MTDGPTDGVVDDHCELQNQGGGGDQWQVTEISGQYYNVQLSPLIEKTFASN